MTHSSWGPGWPNCQVDKVNRNFYVDTIWGRVTFPGGVRHEITELVTRLVKETANRGYRFGVVGNPSYGCWGFNCRAIAGTNSPSNHSWALAVDINAPKNPMGATLITDMPSWMPDLWNAYGFRWGGDYVGKKDAMHYEFMGSVAQAAQYTAIARRNRLGENRVPPKPSVGVPSMTTFLFRANNQEWRLYDGGVCVDLPYERSRDLANEIIATVDEAHKAATGKILPRQDNLSLAAYLFLSTATQNKADEAPMFLAQVETGERFLVANDRSSRISDRRNPDEFNAAVYVLTSRGFDMTPAIFSTPQLADIPEISDF